MHPTTGTGQNESDGRPTQRELVLLRPLARQFPNIDAAYAEIARLSAILTLPMGTIHVISDVHGEHRKLRHIINNASGTLRPLVERLFRDRLTPEEFQAFLTLIFYPAEVTERLEAEATDQEQVREFSWRTLRHLFELVRVLAARYSFKRALRVVPPEYVELYAELLHEPTADRGREFIDAIVDQLLRRGRALHLVHITCRLVRNLAVHELIIAGDCWDRGPRGDRVVDYLRHQPNVSFVWGNHDVAWLGACLGHEPLICHVLRISLRYRRIRQIDEGYSIPTAPLEHLFPADCVGPAAGRPRRPDAQGSGDPAVQAGGAAHREAPGVGHGRSAASAPHRLRGRHGGLRRRCLSAPRHAVSDDRSGRPLSALAGGGRLPGPDAALVSPQPKALGARALDRAAWSDVPAAQRASHLPWLRPL